MNKTSKVLLASTLAFAALSTYLAFKTSRDETTTRKADEARSQVEARLAKSEAENSKLQQEVRDLKQSRDETRSALSANPATEISSSVTAKRESETRPAPAAVQRSTVDSATLAIMQRDVARSRYGELIREMGLSAEESQQFLDIVLKYTGISGGVDPRQLDPELARFLNPSRFDQYLEFKKTMAERQRVASLRAQLARERIEVPTADQERRLIQAMTDVRNGFPLPRPAQSISPAESREQFLQWQNEFDRRILESAKPILSDAQFEALRLQTESSIQMRHLAFSRSGPP